MSDKQPLNELPELRYRTIVADPPWIQKAGPLWDGRGKDSKTLRNYGTKTNSKTRELPYPQMSVDEICNIDVRSFSADNAHLYLWATNKYLEQGFDVCRAWGFRPVQTLVWAKKPRGMGLGGTFVQTTEFIIFARRGSLPASRRIETSWWEIQRTYAHSIKPDFFMDIVEQVSPGPYLEMFSRRARLGWDTWGNESLHGGTAA